MPSTRQLHDIGILNKGLALLGISLSPVPTERMKYHLPIRCLRYSDGSICALWPTTLHRPQIFRFLPQRNAEDRKWVGRIRMALALNLPSLAGIETCVLYTSKPVVRKLRLFPAWTIFMEPARNDRRMIIWHRNMAGEGGLTKLSLSVAAAKSTYRERLALQRGAPDGMKTPRLLRPRGFSFTQEDLREMEELPEFKELNQLPAALLQKWATIGLKQKRLAQIGWYRQATQLLSHPGSAGSAAVSVVLLQKMRIMFECLVPDARVPVAHAHGNFTPQHLRLGKHRLVVAGWGACDEELPVLFDWFHNLYVTRSQYESKPFLVIRKEIDERLAEPGWEAFLFENDIDPNEAEQQYLLCALSRFLNANSQPDAADRQLLQTWCEALGFWMDFEGLLTQRQIVLQDLIHLLHGHAYAALNLEEPDITALPLSEGLELCMPPESLLLLRQYLSRHRCVQKLRYRPTSDGGRLELFLSGGASLRIKGITRLRYGSLVFGDVGALLAQTEVNEAGVHCLPLHVREHYRQLRQALIREEAVPPAAHLSDPSQNQALFSIRAFSDNYLTLRKALHSDARNKGLQRLKNQWTNLASQITGWMPHRGFVITFSGVDEAGQRTVIEATRHRIRHELQAPVVVLPHHPRLAAVIAQARPGRRDEIMRQIGQGAERQDSRSVSLLRRFEEMCVQVYVLLRYVLRGYVVIYDQFYECPPHGQAGRVRLPFSLTAWWHRFLLKPDLNFLLVAPPTQIRERHVPLTSMDTDRITADYLSLFDQMNRQEGMGRFIPVRNASLDNTVDVLFRYINRQQLLS